MTGRLVLKAGPLTCVLDGPDIRDLAVAGQRVLTRLYIAVRDEAWNTIPFEYTVRDSSSGPDHFRVELWCSVDAAPVQAEWAVFIAGNAEGEFSYAMKGQALSSFRYAKIGLNLHHPLPEYLGAKYVVRRGAQTATGRVPSLIDPQLFVDGKLTGMFMPYEQLVLQSAADDEVVFGFEGDEFEMQDHRNWTDYNLKSYSTPLEVPLPQTAQPGQPIVQSVAVDARRTRALRHGPGSPATRGPERAVVIRDQVVELPQIGSEFADEVANLDGDAAGLIGQLPLDYVRVNLDLTGDDGAMGAAADKARQVGGWGRPIELVLVVSPGEASPGEIDRLDRWLEQARPQLARVVVLEGPRGFFIGRTTSSPANVRAYRGVVEKWAGPTKLVCATEQFFAELNRWWPEMAGVDGVGYTVCPQVHAADDISLMENSWGQADTVTTARARSAGRAVHITSVAMIGKFGPYPGGPPDVAVRSAYGDARQYSSFAAAWTVSSLCQLVGSQAASATYFELTGARGLVDSDRAGVMAGPVYRALEAVLSWGAGNVVQVGTVAGANIVGLGAEWPDRSELLVANLAPEGREVELTNLAGAVVEFSELNCEGPTRGAAWVASPPREPTADRPGGTTFTIGGYGVARIRTV